jgi:hypothetical protein
MKTRHLFLTTALAALLAGPGMAQDTGTDDRVPEASGDAAIGSYLVGDLIGRPVRSADGTEIGRAEAVVGEEGGGTPQILVTLQDRTIGLPLDEVQVSDTGDALVIDRQTSDLEQMAAFDGSDRRTLDPGLSVSEAVAGSNRDMDGGATDGGDAAGTLTAEQPSELADSGAATSMDGTETAEGGDVAATSEGGGTGATDMAQDPQPMTDDGTLTAQDDQLVTDGETGMAEGDAATTGTDATGSDMAGTNAIGTDGATTEMPDLDPQTATPTNGFAGLTVGDLLAMNVVGGDGEMIGDIEYLYRDGSGAYMAVIGIGGFLGIGEHTVSVPLGDFTVDREGNMLMLDATEAQLEAMPELDDEGIEELSNEHQIEV